VKILCTGSLGFLGSFLCERLLDDGHHVVGIDDLSGNVVDQVDGMETLEQDIGRVSLSKFRSFDLVVHCASPVGAVGLLPIQGLIAGDIVGATTLVAQFAARHDIAMLHVSSSEIYGRSGTYREHDNLIVPGIRRNARLEYAAGKIAAEFTVANMPELRSLTIRPFNVVGPRQSRAKGFVLPTFIEQALGGGRLTIFGDGMQKRALTAVQDVVEFIATQPTTSYPVAGRAVNIGNPQNSTTITALAYRVLRRCGREGDEGDVEFTSGVEVHGPAYAEAEGREKLPDITLASEMGWEPLIDLELLVDMAVREHERVAAP